MQIDLLWYVSAISDSRILIRQTSKQTMQTSRNMLAQNSKVARVSRGNFNFIKFAFVFKLLFFPTILNGNKFSSIVKLWHLWGCHHMTTLLWCLRASGLMEGFIPENSACSVLFHFPYPYCPTQYPNFIPNPQWRVDLLNWLWKTLDHDL